MKTTEKNCMELRQKTTENDSRFSMVNGKW